MRFWPVISLSSLLLLTTPAVAIDDRFNPGAYPKGGFAPATDAPYRKECGSCHFTYLPGMLPARSWQALLGNRDHFGESLDLAPELARGIASYLDANAADRSDYLGSRVLMERIPDTAAPLRITALPLFRTRHAAAEAAMRSGPRVGPLRPPAPGSTRMFLNCGECHERAEAGSFAQKELHVRAVSVPLRPGAGF